MAPFLTAAKYRRPFLSGSLSGNQASAHKINVTRHHCASSLGNLSSYSWHISTFALILKRVLYPVGNRAVRAGMVSQIIYTRLAVGRTALRVWGSGRSC